MTQAHENSIIRIVTSSGVPVGTGFLASSARALTCAHVVAAALRQPLTAEMPAAELSLDFPLQTPGDKRTARVVSWSVELDAAALEISGEFNYFPQVLPPVM